MAGIHPSANIHPSARLHPSVQVGAYVTIGADTELAEGCRVMSGAYIDGPTLIGRGTVIHPFAAIGGDPQIGNFDTSDRSRSRLEIGKNCVIREYVSINRGSTKGDGVTVIGNDCMLMSYVHIGHDCRIGDHAILTTFCGLAGHVTVGKRVNISGECGVAQFCEIGDYVFVAGKSAIRHNIPPYCIVQGSEVATARGINAVGLQRNHFTREQVRDIRRCFQAYFGNRQPKKEIIPLLTETFGHIPHVRPFLTFVQNKDKICSYAKQSTCETNE